MNDEKTTKVPAEARRRGLLIMWGAQALSVVLFFALARFIRPASGAADGNHTLAWALGAVGFMTFVASFLVKRKILAQAVAERRIDLGTTAYVLAFVMCEATAILGFVAYLVTGLSYALHSFIIAAVGLVLHFPARGALDQIEATNAGADFKTTL
ncbi:MAG TPA: hypothetical protein VJT82_07790 [Pyrinomonadaceae bacterium]|nr:hypothetical protein [Pyrinomonadaceae bacterium]